MYVETRPRVNFSYDRNCKLGCSLNYFAPFFGESFLPAAKQNLFVDSCELLR
jgi:hypothetical protein